jgi:diguanylate cyclase (GGDEF)-like protein/PAS domain S-box-containing protein
MLTKTAKITDLIESRFSIALTQPARVLFVSSDIDNLLGFKEEVFLNGNITLESLIHKDDKDIADVLFSNEIYPASDIFNIRIRHADGRIRCIKAHYTKHVDHSGKEIILDLLLQDSKSLWQCEFDQTMMANFKSMMDITDDIIYFKDRNHVFTAASQTLVAFTDPSENWMDLIGKTDYDLLPEEYADIYYSLEKKVFSGVNIANEIQETLDKYGNKGWVDNKKYPIKNDKGEIVGLFGIARDITERKQIENKLKESEERLALAMLGTQDGLWDWNLLTDKVYYSPRWKSMLGYAENEIENNFSDWKRLVHPDDLDGALFNIEYFLKNKALNYTAEFRMQHKAGHYINILSRAFVVEGSDGNVTRLVGTHIDVTEQKKAEAMLSYQSTHDDLTGLLNRREFERIMEQLVTDARENAQCHALCYLDLDQFKVVNDTCGHAAGDEMLKQISLVLQKIVRNSDNLARLGGDEFGILLKNCALEDARRLANSIQTELKDCLLAFKGHSFRASASIGLVPITATTINSIELLKDADAACYMAKDGGRNRIHVRHETDNDLIKWHSETLWANRIQKAIDENRFCLYGQSIVPLNNSKAMHYELLIRMQDDEGNLIQPSAFLPAAERYNLMLNLDQWVIKNAFETFANNPNFQRNLSFICINLSGQSLANDNFLDFVIQKIHEYGIDGRSICFEITETAAISNLLKADKFICMLRQFGCLFALDDFGSGFSSFGYLKSLPVDFLKIDGMFVKDMVKDPIDHAMVKYINEIGHVMGIQTIAEFVENDEIKGMLREMNVDYAQGYGIHKPQPLDELLRS